MNTDSRGDDNILYEGKLSFSKRNEVPEAKRRGTCPRSETEGIDGSNKARDADRSRGARGLH